MTVLPRPPRVVDPGVHLETPTSVPYGRPNGKGRTEGWSAIDLIAPASVVALLYIGFFKGAPFLSTAPVDLTVLAAACVSLGVLGFLVRVGGTVRIPGLALLFVAVCLPAALYAATNPFADDKRIRLLIPLLAVVGAGALVRNHRRQQVWVWLHVAVGVLLVATSSSIGLETSERFSGAGSTTIAAGRASGVAVVVLAILLFTRQLRWWLALAAVLVAGWLAFVLVGTGSRGPVLACAASVLIVAAVVPGRARPLRVLTAVGVLVSGWLYLAEATGFGATRIAKTLSGEYSLTSSRQALWRDTLEAIPAHPAGVGWGNFWGVLSVGSRLNSGYDQYPHNVLLEATIEAGWLAGLAALLVIVASLRRLGRFRQEPYGAALLGIAIFFVLNALVSGDVNDNRMMWAALAMAWVVRPSPTSPPAAAAPGRGAPPGQRSGSRWDTARRHNQPSTT